MPGVLVVMKFISINVDNKFTSCIELVINICYNKFETVQPYRRRAAYEGFYIMYGY